MDKVWRCFAELIVQLCLESKNVARRRTPVDIMTRSLINKRCVHTLIGIINEERLVSPLAR